MSSSSKTVPSQIINQLRQSADAITRWAVNCVIAIDPTRTNRNNPHKIDGKYVNIVVGKIQAAIRSSAEKLLRECHKKSVPIISAGGNGAKKKLANDQYYTNTVIILSVIRLRQPLLWQKLVVSKAATIKTNTGLKELREKYENQGESRRGNHGNNNTSSTTDQDDAVTVATKFCIPDVCPSVALEDVSNFTSRAQTACAEFVEAILEELAELENQKNSSNNDNNSDDATATMNKNINEETKNVVQTEQNQQSFSSPSEKAPQERDPQQSLSSPETAPLLTRMSSNNSSQQQQQQQEENTNSTNSNNNNNQMMMMMMPQQQQQQVPPTFSIGGQPIEQDATDALTMRNPTSGSVSAAQTPAERARKYAALFEHSSTKKKQQQSTSSSTSKLNEREQEQQEKVSSSSAKTKQKQTKQQQQQLWLWSADGLVDETGSVAIPSGNNNNPVSSSSDANQQQQQNNKTDNKNVGRGMFSDDDDDDDDSNLFGKNNNNNRNSAFQSPHFLLSANYRKPDIGSNDVRFKSINNFSSLFSSSSTKNKNKRDQTTKENDNNQNDPVISKEEERRKANRIQRRALRRLRQENEDDDEVAFFFEGQNNNDNNEGLKKQHQEDDDDRLLSATSSDHDDEDEDEERESDEDDGSSSNSKNDNMSEEEEESDDDLDDAKKLKKLEQEGKPKPKCYICGFSAVRRIVIRNTSSGHQQKSKDGNIIRKAYNNPNNSNNTTISGNNNTNLLLQQQQNLLYLMMNHPGVQNTLSNSYANNATTTGTTNQRTTRFTKENKMIGTSAFSDWNDIERSYFENSVAIQSFHSLSPFGNYFGSGTTVVGKSEAITSSSSSFSLNEHHKNNKRRNNMHHHHQGEEIEGAGDKGNKTLLVDIHQTAIDEWKDDTELASCRVCGLWFHYGCILPSRRRSSSSIKKSKVCTRCMVVQLRDRSTDSFGTATEDFNHLLKLSSRNCKTNHREHNKKEGNDEDGDDDEDEDLLFHGRKLFRSTMYF